MTPKPMTPAEQRARINADAQEELRTLAIAAASEGLPPGAGTLIRALVEEDKLTPAAARKRILEAEAQVARQMKPTETRR